MLNSNLVDTILSWTFCHLQPIGLSLKTPVLPPRPQHCYHQSGSPERGQNERNTPPSKLSKMAALPTPNTHVAPSVGSGWSQNSLKKPDTTQLSPQLCLSPPLQKGGPSRLGLSRSLIYLCIYLFIAVLGFELGAYPLSHSTSPFLLVISIFKIGS
jgi:hypothetical protein